MIDLTENRSVKALLTTKQRIPGLGNYILQDILHTAKIHSKTKLYKLDSGEIAELYNCVK